MGQDSHESFVPIRETEEGVGGVTHQDLLKAVGSDV